MSANAAPQNIPIRRIQISHPSEIPSDYGTTPGGTMFSTTPGGTRIIYDRLFLLKCRDSPLSKTPPPNLPDIPGVTTPDRSPAKHVIGKIPEESVENGKMEAFCHRYPTPNHFQFPVPCYNANDQLRVPFPYNMKNGYGSRLVQYRRRQSLAQLKHDGFPPPAYNDLNGPPPDFRGIFSPSPIPMDQPPYGPPPPMFVHPIQGPTGPVVDQRPVGHLSQLTLWRRSQSQSSGLDVQGYTTPRAPRLRSSFEGHGEGYPPMRGYGRGRGLQHSPPFDRHMSMGSNASSMGMYGTPQSSMSSSYTTGYDSSFSDNDLVMVIPDDPSIIAYKPLQKHKTDMNANCLPPFSPIPAAGM